MARPQIFELSSHRLYGEGGRIVCLGSEEAMSREVVHTTRPALPFAILLLFFFLIDCYALYMYWSVHLSPESHQPVSIWVLVSIPSGVACLVGMLLWLFCEPTDPCCTEPTAISGQPPVINTKGVGKAGKGGKQWAAKASPAPTTSLPLPDCNV